MNNKTIFLKTIGVGAMLFALASCSKPESVAGKLNGIWECEWEDNIGEDDVEDIHVTEVLCFSTPEDSKSDDSGEFVQVFAGDVDFDDWEFEDNLAFQAYVEGKWKLVDNDQVDLSYDLSSLIVETGQSSVKVDATGCIMDLLSGDFNSMIGTAIVSAAKEEKAKQKITELVNKQVTKYFKDYLRELKHEKPAMKDIVVDDDILKCKMNYGFMGNERTYEYKGEEFELASAVTASTGIVVIPEATAKGTNFDNPFTWLSQRKVTQSDLSGLTKSQLRILRNAIFAIHGHKFNSRDLRTYFESFAWYTPVGDASSQLSPLEQENVAIIKSYE